MRSTFFGIETMRRAILTHRQVMDVIGHNVANAATPGYSRQRAILDTTPPFAYPGFNKIDGAGQIGTGVTVTSIERIRDSFVDNQLRIGTSNQGELAVEQDALNRIESTLMEPSTTEGLGTALSKFYDTWQKLSMHPENIANRQEVVSKAQNLVAVVNQIDQSLRDIRSDLDGQVRKDVTEVNRVLHEIAALNTEIGKVTTSGDAPNDLMDKRDLLIDELSKYMDVAVSGTDANMIAINVGTRQLVWNNNVKELDANVQWDHPSQNSQTPYFTDVSQADFNMIGDFARGELKGLLTARDVMAPDAQRAFTQTIQTIMDEINNAHSTAFGQKQFTQDLGLFSTTDITTQAVPAGPDNVVTLTSVKNINVGDTLRLEEPDSVVKAPANEGRDGISVKVTSISGNTIYFEQIDHPLRKDGYANDPTANAVYQVKSGAKVYKIDSPKNNFFELNTTLPAGFIGDTKPSYNSRMTSITLDQRITDNTTLKDLESLYGVDITGLVTGKTVSLDDNARSVGFTEGMTLGNFITRVNEVRPKSADGQPLNLTFDTVNHRLLLNSSGIGGLGQLGGKDGSEMNLLRILGFEGQHITGFQLTEGTTVDATTLGNIGVADGWFTVDGMTLKADSTLSIKNNMTAWNNALAAGDTTKGTQFFFDPVERRMKIISTHQFSVRDATAPYPDNTSFSKSNLHTTMGFRDADGEIAFSVDQQKASVTTSDVGARIKVNNVLIEDVNKIATASNAAGSPGDNSAALSIAATRDIRTLNNTGTGINEAPTQTIEDFYSSSVAKIGSESQRVQVDGQVVQKFIDYYTQRRQEISGVSLDEEMTRMVQAQQSFNAAARMLNTVDEMLDKVINGMGLVGR